MNGGAPEIQPTPKVPGPDNKLQEARRRAFLKAVSDGANPMNLMEDYVSASFDPKVTKRTLGGE